MQRRTVMATVVAVVAVAMSTGCAEFIMLKNVTKGFGTAPVIYEYQSMMEKEAIDPNSFSFLGRLPRKLETYQSGADGMRARARPWDGAVSLEFEKQTEGKVCFLHPMLERAGHGEDEVARIDRLAFSYHFSVERHAKVDSEANQKRKELYANRNELRELDRASVDKLSGDDCPEGGTCLLVTYRRCGMEPDAGEKDTLLTVAVQPDEAGSAELKTKPYMLFWELVD